MITNLAGKNILIVDDEPDLSEILCSEMNALGARCQRANDVSQAFDIFNTQALDCIVSDIRMPGQTGVDLLRIVRSHTPLLPMILMTGYADVSLPRAHDLGAEAMINKPFDLEELGQLILHVTVPLPKRWKVVPSFQNVRTLKAQDVTPGRGGLFIKSEEPPRIGMESNVSFGTYTFAVVCRWHFGENWGGEIVAWDQASKELGWPYLDSIPFIPLRHSAN